MQRKKVHKGIIFISIYNDFHYSGNKKYNYMEDMDQVTCSRLSAYSVVKMILHVKQGEFSKRTLELMDNFLFHLIFDFQKEHFKWLI